MRCPVSPFLDPRVASHSQNARVSRGANLHVLAAFEPDVFTALRHDTGRACAATDDRADSSALAAAGNRANNRADTRCCANFRCVVFRRTLTFDATLRINVRVLVTNGTDLYELGVQRGAAIVSCTNLIEC